MCQATTNLKHQHYFVRLEALEKQLADIVNATTAELEARIREERQAAVELRRERLEKNEMLRERYETMLSEVLAWEPPSEDHRGLKEFMRSQLDTSIQWDLWSVEQLEAFYPIPGEETSVAYRARCMRDIGEDLRRHKANLAEAQSRVRVRNDWMDLLRESLGIDDLEEDE